MKSWLVTRLATLVVLVFAFTPAHAASSAPPPSSAATAARLLALARLWGDIKYFDPELAYRDIDWDDALIAATPKVEAATTAAEYAAALESMLAVLHDPSTCVLPLSSVVAKTAPSKGPFVTAKALGGGAAVVAFDWNADPSLLVDTQVGDATKTIVASKTVIVDLRAARAPTDAQAAAVATVMQSSLGRVLFAGVTTLPAQRTRWYHGFANQTLSLTAGSFYGGFRTIDAMSVSGTASSPRRIGFLVDKNSFVPLLAIALARDGLATILTAGDQPRHDDEDTGTLAMTDGVVAQIRLGEYADVAADAPLAVKFAPSGDSVTSAVAWVEKHAASTLALPKPPPGRLTYDAADSSPPFPNDAHRLLGVFRIYNAVRYFWPYKDLMGNDWDDATLQAIRDVGAARDARSYLSRKRSAISAYSGKALREARAELGTTTLEDIVNEALRRATSQRRRRISAALDVFAGALFDDRADAWS